jgi:hypothetical protein
MTKEEILSFQARWMRPAGVAAILGAALITASGVVGRIGVPAASNNAEQLLNYQEHSGQLVLSAVITSLGLLLLIVPLYFLFRSALARAPRMRGFLGAFVIIGPIMVATQGTLFSLALKDASDTYVAGVPAVEAKARAAAARGQKAQAAVRDATTTTNQATTAAGKAATKTGTVTRASGTAGATPPGACVKPVDDCISAAKDDFAHDTIINANPYRVSQVTGLLGGLLLIIGAIYTLLWSIRTGLLTRFAATLGMILLASLLLIPAVGPVGVVLWFAVLGLMLAGWWPRPRPPAWAAGEAIPLVKPGQGTGPPLEERGPSGTAPSDTVEGSGREISETVLPENGGPADQPGGETQGQRRKKRKRRN